jgi:acetyl/propionyl-CoA carboxylase alpha subunit
MFKKVLIANRGEIAVRIVRACRDLGIDTVALYDASDRGSLHVRLADECVSLRSDLGYMDQDEVLWIARDTGAEAIHPGYGFLAERADFAQACDEAGIAFVGPPSDVLASLYNKLVSLQRAKEAGFAVAPFSESLYDGDDLGPLAAEADRLGYPVVIKSVVGGRSRGTRLARSADALEALVRQVQADGQLVFGDRRVFLEKAILPSRHVEVQVLGDHHGNLIHLGDRDGSIQRNNQKVVEETPAPYLTQSQREQLWRMSVEIAQLFGCRSACTVEFLLDPNGQFYFTEIKPRIQVEHPLSEMVSMVDIVKEQLRIATGQKLIYKQSDIRLRGWAMQCRVNAEDPWNNFLPSPGHIRRFRLPSGPYVRVDTYAYTGCDVPLRYDPFVANVAVWGENRVECLWRMRRTIEDFAISGIQTNLPLIQRILYDPEFLGGEYTTEFARHRLQQAPATEAELRDLAVAAAIAYVRRTQSSRPTVPERTLSGWHRDSRRLPS